MSAFDPSRILGEALSLTERDMANWAFKYRTTNHLVRYPLMSKAFPLQSPQDYDALRELVPDARLRAHSAKERLDRLSPRQRQVLNAVVEGRLNKQIAYALGIDEKTVKMHRTLMKTVLGVRSSAEAIRIAVEASFDGD